MVFPKIITWDTSNDHQKLLHITCTNFFFQGKRIPPCKTFFMLALENSFRRMSCLASFHRSLFLTWCSRVLYNWKNGTQSQCQLFTRVLLGKAMENTSSQLKASTTMLLLLVGTHACKNSLPLPPPDHKMPFPTRGHFSPVLQN